MNHSRHETRGVKLAPKAVVGRVSLYLRQLESFQFQGHSTISSSQLGARSRSRTPRSAKTLPSSASLVNPGSATGSTTSFRALRQALGIDHDWPLALVGLGNLGRALLKYRGFPSRRFHIVALFDNDPRKIGQVHEGLKVEPIEGFRKAIATRNISLALLCVPADAAQRVADQMVASGIRGILNFAPVPLVVPPTVNVVAVDLSIQLENLAYKAQKTAEDVNCAG